MSGRFWWVNHSQTFRHEIDGSYLWFALKPSKSKAGSVSDKNTQLIGAGDVIFSFANGEIGAIGVALGGARQSPRPVELGSVAQLTAASVGSLVPVRFMVVAQPFRPVQHGEELSPVLPRRHSPILANGNANQHLPLASVPPLMAASLQRLLGGEVERIVGAITEALGRSLAEDIAEAAIQQRSDIGATRKSDLLQARRGHGAFRGNLERIELSCRITGVLDRRHLWAIHIKPWFECDDDEKLNGCNGLLMSPHVAHLFERGYISFSDDGELLLSRELNPVVAEQWHLVWGLNVGAFKSEQGYFLDYHRREVFQQHGGGRRQKSLDNFEPLPAIPDAEPAVVHPA